MTEAEPRPHLLEDDSSTRDLTDNPLGPLSEPPAPRIFLRQPDRFMENEHRPGRLARLVGLEQYSATLLTRKVRVELSVLAGLLLGVFFFELAAWSYFFNGVFTGNMFELHPIGTTAALILAMLFAGTILFLERQMITTDTLRLGASNKRWAQTIRILSIVGAGLIVAHAVDLLAFEVPVANRLHLEAVKNEVLRLDKDLRALEEGGAGGRREIVADDLAVVRNDLAGAREDRKQAVADQGRFQREVILMESEVRRRRSSLQNAESRLSRLSGSYDYSAERAARQDLQMAQDHLDQALADLREAKGGLGAARERLQEADRRIDSLSKEEAQLRVERSSLVDHTALRETTLETLQGRLRSWMTELATAKPGGDLYVEEWQGWRLVTEEEMELWPEGWRDALTFSPPERSFFDKIHLVHELAWGWLGGSEKDQAGLPNYLPWDEVRGTQSSMIYSFAFLGIHLAAVFVPFLVFTVKWFLMPKEVDSYFSVWHQAYSGDPDAQLILNTERKVQQRKQDGYW